MTTGRDAKVAHDTISLAGLPRTISETLLEHKEWVTDEVTGKARCAGRGCGWEKPPGKSGTRAWQKHQTYTMQVAVANWLAANTITSARLALAWDEGAELGANRQYEISQAAVYGAPPPAPLTNPYRLAK